MIPVLALIWPKVSKYLIGAGIILAIGLAIWLYGHTQYRAGARDTRTEIAQQTAALERAAQEDKDRADAIYRGKILASEATAKRWNLELVNTGRRLRELRKQLQTAGTCGGLDDAGNDWIGILGESWAGYQDMANEAGRLADKVGGLQGYIRSLPISKAQK